MSVDFFKYAFQISPIILTGGAAAQIPGGMLPILALSNALSFVGGLLNGGANFSLDDSFASFQPLPGSTLIDQKIGMYPFANQSVAANAVIAEPLTVSMLMICPARASNGGWASKLAAMIAFQATLKQHNESGGTYTIATPSFFYTDCVMTGMSDVSHSESKQVQNTYKLDFVKPLITLDDAQTAQNSMMSKISGGVPTAGELNGLNQTVNAPATLSNTMPMSTSMAGGGVAGPIGNLGTGGAGVFQPSLTGFQ